jgi:hypothetical protein
MFISTISTKDYIGNFDKVQCLRIAKKYLRSLVSTYIMDSLRLYYLAIKLVKLRMAGNLFYLLILQVYRQTQLYIVLSRPGRTGGPTPDR